jgi:hypothetical protein
MVVAVHAHSPRGETLELELSNTDSGFLVAEIEGLDPVKTTITSSTFAGMAGAQFQSSKRESRNLVLKLKPRPNSTHTTVRALREYLYRFFMTRQDVHLTFYDEEVGQVEIDGIVEETDFPIFTKDPDITVNILCLLPDFYDLEVNTYEGETVQDLTMDVIEYRGTIETGFDFKMTVTDTLEQFSIVVKDGNNVHHTLEFAYPLEEDDILEIRTIDGDKGAYLYRDGTVRSVLYGIAPYSEWVNLYPGENEIRVQVPDGGSNFEYTIEYTDKFGGL